MPTQAKVSSLDALDAFRSSLIIYIERARHILDDVQYDVHRTRTWLEQEQQPHLKKEIRVRSRALAQAEQELLTARLSEQAEAVRDRRRTVDRARAKLQEAEGALEKTRRWFRQFDREIDPRMRTTQLLRQTLDADLVKAVALLSETTRVLTDYAAVSPGSNPTPTPTPNPSSTDANQTDVQSPPDREPDPIQAEGGGT
jgi:hypothetical protein